MIDCDFFYNLLTEKGVEFFTGVPDSLLKYFCAYVTDHSSSDSHIIAANEGAAIALACGHYLGSGKLALVYMQNSGIGNAVNPLVSLADPEVYRIPVLMLVGWRGEPGKKDEPQHVKQGRITQKLLDTLEIPYEILPETNRGAQLRLENALEVIRQRETPYAFLVRKGTFNVYEGFGEEIEFTDLSREDSIKLIVDAIHPQDLIISTTGKISRELYEYREHMKSACCQDFLTVGSMGHASQIALGISLQTPDRQVFCLDGDGAAIMHMGSMAIIGSQRVPNFKHIILNNGAHDSVGGQPTVGYNVSFVEIAKKCGYKIAMEARTKKEVCECIEQLKTEQGPGLLEVKVRKGSRVNLGRPAGTPEENKKAFMDFLSK